ncbi:hypothetical protein Q75_15460 [Bacillus coahuilensis p1.1.43]|uniref:DUF1232 domain-containing protein n=1 Tax=Bacillus coahuilensis p1.1.43 TaxID=1150625 RepID=A0A147K4T3_9BACI|nr:hypothetical protein Q75_15460 [Bacillus coahuilensis p1.1.43]
MRRRNSDGRRDKKSESYYSDHKFWRKVGRVAKKAGQSVIYAALLLYYTLQKEDVPKKVKVTIIGALGYFILPTDLIPDFALGLGFTDDLGALGIALVQVSMYIDDEIKAKAKNRLGEWFKGDIDTKEVDNKLL